MKRAPTPVSQKPLVSVIVPVFDRASVVEKTLDSVKRQTYRPIEILVVDDGSTDESWDVISRWASRNQSDGFRVVHHRQRNAGAPAARNQGMELASGKYLQFLDSDDIIAPPKLAAQVSELECSGKDIAVCDYRYVYSGTNKVRIHRNDGALRARLARGWSAYTSSPLIRAESILGNVWWNEALERQQDMDFLYKVFCIANDFVYTYGVWCDYVYHDGERISDQYHLKPPQFVERIKSLARFGYRMRRRLPMDRKLMLLRGVASLIREVSVYWSKSAIKFLFGTRGRKNVLDVR